MESGAQRIARLAAERNRNMADIPKSPVLVPSAVDQQVQKNNPEIKIYFSKIPNSRFCWPDGQESIFSFGKLVVGPKEFPGNFQGHKDSPHNGKPRYKVYQEELDAIVHKNPIIYVMDAIPDELPLPEQNAQSEAEIAMAEAQMRAAGATVKQEMGGDNTDTSGSPLDPNKSSLDLELQKAMFAREGSASSVS